MSKELSTFKELGDILRRKCFAVDMADFGPTERYVKVAESINNEKAVNNIIAYIEKAKKYCESQGISFDDIAVTLNFGLYYDGDSSDHTFDEVSEKDPIRDFYKISIGGPAYSSVATREFAMGKPSLDPVRAEGYVFIDDESEEFDLGDLRTSFVITYDGFKTALDEMGYELNEECTNFGGFDALKNNTSLRALIQKKQGKNLELKKKFRGN